MIYKSIKSLFSLFLLGLIILLLYTFIKGYQGSVGILIHILHQEKYNVKIFDLISPAKYYCIQLFILCAVFLTILMLYYFKRIYDVARLYVNDFLVSISNSIKLALKDEIKYLLIIPLLSSFYYAIKLPVSYDEAFTYLNFTSRGIFASMTLYTDPNNHVLHSIITNLTTYIPFSTPLINLRISSILANLFTWIFAYSFLKTYINGKIAIVIVAMASMLFLSIYYSYMSRGYVLLCLFFVTSVYFSFNIIKRNNETRDWVWFGFSSVLGFYTMPSFLYPFITLNVLILLFNRHNLTNQVVNNGVVLACVFLLYLPVIIINGLDALINNQYVAPRPRIEVLSALPSFTFRAIEEITGVTSVVVMVLLAISFIMLIIRRDKENILIYALFIISPFLVLAIHSVIPFSRTFIYYGFILIFLIALPWRHLLKMIKPVHLVFVLVPVQCLLLYNFYSKIPQYESYDLAASRVICEIEGNKRYVCNDRLFDGPLRFELLTKGYNGATIRYYNMIKMSADSIVNADYIIIGKEVDVTEIKVPKVVTDWYNVY